MLSLAARGLGNAIIITLAIIGADTVAKRILRWKDAHDQNPGARTV